MKPSAAPSRLTARHIQQKKAADKIVTLTAYTAPIARAADSVADILLVGDSLGMVLYDLPSTLPVTLEDMIRHGAAVVRASKHALVVVDMPFGSYQATPAQAFENAARVMKETACGAVKLEGGSEMAETIRFLTERAIPVMAHIGLQPQHVHMLGGYRYQGRTEEEAVMLLANAEAVQEAGAFALVLECVETSVTQRITQALSIPTIGIGSGLDCDGQVLVSEDLLGFTGSAPRFVKPYASVSRILADAFATYAAEVKSTKFPSPQYSFTKKE